MAKILVTAKQRGSVNAVVGVIRELDRRGHSVDVYATGNDNEVAGFEGISYTRVDKPDFSDEDASDIIQRGKYETVISGLTGYNTPDGTFIRATNRLNIKNIGVNDQDGNYVDRFGTSIYGDGIPFRISLMDDGCLETMANELSEEMTKVAKERARVIGWTAFDSFAEDRERFSSEDRKRILESIGLEIENKVYLHATQNVPGTGHFGYEIRAAEEILRIAPDLKLKLVVKPHPGEEDGKFSRMLAERYGHFYVPAKACNTKDLVLSSDAVTAGRSTMLNEACLLDRNVGGIFQPIKEKELGEGLEFYGEFWSGFPSIKSNALPYVLESDKIPQLFGKLTSKEQPVLNELSEQRKKFSVDGKASERLADLVEETLNS